MTNATMLLYPGPTVFTSPLTDVEPAPARSARRQRRVHPILTFTIRATLALFVGIAISVLTFKAGLLMIAIGFAAQLPG